MSSVGWPTISVARVRIAGPRLADSHAQAAAQPLAHVILSPHLDDAVLSVGGSMHCWAAAGERVLVVSAFTADPPPGEPSAFASELHRRWGVDGRSAYARRREEDEAALRLLGVERLHLHLLDCIYRRADGDWLYPSEEALFGPLEARDAAVQRELTRRLRQLVRRLGGTPTLYAPLAIGGHVDHRLVRQAAVELGWPSTVYYEDFPYCAVLPDDASAGAGVSPAWRGPSPAVPAVANPPAAPASLVLRRQSLERQDVAAKVRAAACYASQLGVLFGSPLAMALQMWRQARRSADGAGYAEVLWHPQAAGWRQEPPSGRANRPAQSLR